MKYGKIYVMDQMTESSVNIQALTSLIVVGVSNGNQSNPSCTTTFMSSIFYPDVSK